MKRCCMNRRQDGWHRLNISGDRTRFPGEKLRLCEMAGVRGKRVRGERRNVLEQNTRRKERD